MNEFRKRFARFCLRNRSKGIPNLMLIIAIGNVIVYLLSTIDPSNVVYSWLCFSRSKVLDWQLWRLVSYVFTFLCDSISDNAFVSGANLFLSAVALFCYYQFGKILEQYWGTLRFNLYYFTGILLTDVAALLLGYPATAGAMNLSLFLAVATIAPEAQVRLFFILPLKMKWLAWVYLALAAWNVIRYMLFFGFLRFVWLLPLVPLANYFLFFGSDVKNLLPASMRYRRPKPGKPRAKPNPNWANSYQSKSGERPYRHKCTVCGRTDTEYPGLEFRYCSKCNGYYCYCIDHINSHAHIQ